MRRLSSLLLGSALAAMPLAAQSTSLAFDPVTMDPPVRDSANPAAVEELSFTSGGARLNALMYVAQGAGPHATVILLHGFPGNERNLDLAQSLRRAGMNVLFFSYRGAWGSGGDFSFANARDDVAAALRFVSDPANAAKLRVDPARVALIGHSMGGWLAMLGAAADTGVRCVAGIEFADMAQEAASAKDPKGAEGLTDYTAWLTAPGAPLHAGASAQSLVAALAASADRSSLVPNARELASRTILLLDNDRNAYHRDFVAALRQANATHLTAEVWHTDHSFSDRRIELQRAVVGWVRGACGY